MEEIFVSFLLKGFFLFSLPENVIECLFSKSLGLLFPFIPFFPSVSFSFSLSLFATFPLQTRSSHLFGDIQSENWEKIPSFFPLHSWLYSGMKKCPVFVSSSKSITRSVRKEKKETRNTKGRRGGKVKKRGEETDTFLSFVARLLLSSRNVSLIFHFFLLFFLDLFLPSLRSLSFPASQVSFPSSSAPSFFPSPSA